MARRPPTGFDGAKLQAMQEPLTVRVMKIRSNSKQPIEIPGRDGAAPGTGFSREDVLALEGFVKDWSGGGFYEGQVVDAGGESMTWTFGWDSRQYPEKIPPTDTAAATPTAAPTQMSQYAAPIPSQAIPSLSGPVMAPASTPLGVRSATWPPPANAFYNSFPQQQMPAPAPVAAPVPVPAGIPAGIPNMGVGMGVGVNGLNGFGGFGNMIHDSRDSDRVRLLEDQLRRMEIDRREADYKTLLDQQARSHAQEIIAMREEIRRTSETRQSGDSDEVRRLRDERERDRIDSQFRAMQEALTKLAEVRAQPDDNRMRDLEARMTQERHEREAREAREKYERDRERDKYDRDRERDKYESQLLVMQQNQNRPDPMVEMMKESARAQADIARENARAQEAQAAKMQTFMVNPLEMMRLVKDNNTGADVMVRNIVDSFGGVFQTYRHALESVAQLQGSGSPSPIVGIVQDGISQGKEVLESYLAMKRDQSVSESKVRQEQARTQGEMARSQQAALAAQARAQQANPGLAGATVPQGNGNGAPQASWSPPPPTVVAQPKPTEAAAPTGPLPDMIHKSEVQNFGVPVVVESVSRLRKGVKAFCETGGKPDPATGKHIGVDPTEAVGAILQGVMFVTEHKIIVPAFGLFEQGRYADLIDILIPHAPQEYKTACVAAMIHHVEGEVDDPEVDEDNGDGDGDDGGAGRDESVAAQA